ncbi:helix-turn-helix transcriptional regulator [Pseudanabaenaceae cyanobacterium LEGE 13415]|nr:helix-turn-helix transcriptional regulator [Pseudanabaenaceae cyanobacterium LEGE 13415]
MSGNMNSNTSNRGNEGLKALREEAGLNKSQMAKATGISARMWQRYENEGRMPESIDFVLRTAVLTGKSVDEVLKLIGFKYPSREQLLQEIENAETPTT